MRSMEVSETHVVARLLAMGSLALFAFGVVLTIGLASAGSALEFAMAAAMVVLVIAAALACVNAAVHFGRSDGRPRTSVHYLVPERARR